MTSIDLNGAAKTAAIFRAILRYRYAGTAMIRHNDPRGCSHGGLTSGEPLLQIKQTVSPSTYRHHDVV